MSDKVICTKSKLTAIANKIRSKLSSQDTYTLDEMPAAIESIGGSVTIESLSITQNGTYSEQGKAYTPVVVNVEGYKLEDMPTGAIATITDAAALPLNDLKVSINPVQAGSGDPSPTNIRPISGWSELNLSDVGTNLWDEEWENGYWKNGQYTKFTNVCSKNKIPVKPNSNVYIIFPNNTIFFYSFYDKDKNLLNIEEYDSVGRLSISIPGIINIPPCAYYMTWNMNSVYGTTYNNDISINYPSTDTSYHAYNGQLINVKFKVGTDNITVYDGYVNLVTGELVSNAYYIKGGWTQFNASNGYKAYRINNVPQKKTVVMTDDIICNMINEYGSFNSAAMDRNIIQPPAIVSGQYVIYMALDENIDPNDVQVLYKLATPITYQLDPASIIRLLEGLNNIFADTGNILEGEYFVAL